MFLKRLENAGEQLLLYCIDSLTQPAITCSNLTTEPLEQGVKHVQSYPERHQNDAKFFWTVKARLTLLTIQSKFINLRFNSKRLIHNFEFIM